MRREDLTFVEHEKPFRYEEDGLTVTRGCSWSAPGCHLGCGVLMYTDADGELVKVEGDPENPFNQGRLCVRCLAAPAAVHSPERIRKPMRRLKENRGKDIWEELSYDEAFDIIEEKFGAIKAEYGAESVAFLVGTGRDISAYISRLAWSFGSPNFGPMLNGIACYAPRVYGCFTLAGSFFVGDYSQQFADRYDNPNWETPGAIFVWGNNPVVANSDGAYGHWVTDCLQRGSKMVVIDPKLTWLAARADLWIDIRPGTDAALALAIGNVMVEEKLYDADFVDKWCYGFDEYAEAVKDYTPEAVAEICWTDAEKIRRAARMFAESSSALVQWGVALDQKEEAVTTCQAVASLLMITGNIDKPGSMITPPELLMYLNGWGQELLSPEQAAKRLGLDRYVFYGAGVSAMCCEALVDAMETGEPYPVKAAWIQTSNFLTCMGVDPERTIKAFNSLDFVVMVDPFKNPTMMALADLVLPVTMFTERDGIRCGDGAQRAETINRASDPHGLLSDMEINLELGRRFNPQAWPWDTVQDMYSTIYETIGMTFEEVQAEGPGYIPYEYYKYEKGLMRPDGKPGFNTPTGRLELFSNMMNGMGLPAVPRFEEPVPGPVATPELADEFPFVLTTGARHWGMFHAENRENLYLRRLHPEPTLQMHPDAAAELGVTEGEWVWVEGPRGTTGQTGRCKRLVEITPAIANPKVMSTDHAWWHPEGDPEKLFDMFELNVNQLMSWGCGPSGIGANYKCLLCRVYKVGEGE